MTLRMQRVKKIASRNGCWRQELLFMMRWVFDLMAGQLLGHPSSYTRAEFLGPSISVQSLMHGVTMTGGKEELGGKPKVLLDPNQLSKDGTVSLDTYSVSEEASYFAYVLSSGGSYWETINVMKTEERIVKPDTLSWKIETEQLKELKLHQKS